MINESIKVTGRIKVELIRDGKVVQTIERDNIVTTAGKNAIAALLNSASAGTSLVTHMGFGTSSTAVAVGDTALGTEMSGSGYARAAVTRSNPVGNQIQYVATLTNISAVTTIQEAGLFSAATGGTLVAHVLTGAVQLQTTADSLQLTWQVNFN